MLVCGLPGAGKTALAQQLERDLPAVRMCPDEWLVHLGIDLRDGRARARLEALFWQQAQRLLHLGQSVILEYGFWGRSERDEKRLGARALGAQVELRVLDLPLDELWRRVEQRNESGTWQSAPITRQEMERWAGLFQKPDAAEVALFDAPFQRAQSRWRSAATANGL